MATLETDYLVIGEARCGTTSFYKWLIRHPAVGPVLTKEVQYFSDEYDRGLSWYRGHFPTIAYAKLVERRQGTRMVTGEASPYYLFHPLARDRPDAALADAGGQDFPGLQRNGRRRWTGRPA